MVEVFEGMDKGKAACVFEGKMIDIAAYRRALNTLMRAKIIKEG